MLFLAITFLVRAVMLGALLRLLEATDKHHICAAISWAVEFGLLLVLGAKVEPTLFRMLFFIPLSSIYFWLLHKYPQGLLYWVVLLVGFSLANAI